ncbi:hypothetical protein [Micromonospora sp. NPDC126480]|uniref:hypothetical protein n=1 Tax=Micromonospora sp. NPDC126480 TaxID=3155312 RepID=UPI00332B9105
MRVRLVAGFRAGAATVTVVLVVLLLTGYLWRRAGSRPAADDAAAVWCLAAAQRPALAEAARNLGAVHPESTADRLHWPGGAGEAMRWREARPGDFDRVCLALIASRQVGGAAAASASSWSTLAPSLVVTLAGGLLAVGTGVLGAFFSRRLATAGGRRLEAEALRGAARAYRLAVERLLRSLEQPGPGLAPEDEEVTERRLDLAARLNAVAAAHAGWVLPRQLSEALDAGPYGGSLVVRWNAERPERRLLWLTEVRAALGRLEADVERVAQAIQEPGLFRDREPAERR